MIKNQIIIDVGSSSLKTYSQTSDTVRLITTKSIHFKRGDGGLDIAPQQKEELFDFVEAVKKENAGVPMRIFATSFFRGLPPSAKKEFGDEFFERTGEYFHILSHELESFFLEMALVGKCHIGEPLLLINIGGGSTEIIIMYGDEVVERHNLSLGIKSILEKFSNINEPFSGTPLSSVVDFIKANLPTILNTPRIAFYNGGELEYMRLADYSLRKNTLFDDPEHPEAISYNDFSERNKDIFNSVSLSDLESRMPQDPKWMHGARACSALAHAVFEKYRIEIIVPSDSNTAHGMVRRPFRHVVLSGSFRKHLDYIQKIKNELLQREVIVLSPRFDDPKNPGEEFVVFIGEEGRTPLELERHHLLAIERADALVVCSPKGYVGASATMEIGYAHAFGKRIIFTEEPEEFMLRTLPHETGL